MRIALFLPALALAPLLAAADAVTAGRFIVERPTLICLGFEWRISGDDNRNARVESAYRKAGAREWKKALPMLRLGGERIIRPERVLDYTVPDMFAGSILDLEPDTEYEVRFRLHDPDGVKGEAVRTVRVRTRAEPRAAAGGRVLHVYPPGWKGERQQPAYTGLKEAYNGTGGADWNVTTPRRVRAGDIILVHAGLYKGNRFNYTDALSLQFDGAYLLTAKGTPERPVVIRAAGDGEVIFDGDGCHRLFDVMAADYHIFEGLTIRNTDIAFFAGYKDVFGSKGLTVRNCRMEDVGIGVTTQYAGSEDFYIADNVILGRHDPFRLIGWTRSDNLYGTSDLHSYYGVKVYGAGHVVCHNYVAYFHDGIDVCTHGVPDAEEDRRAVSIDIYNNDIHLVADDFIEADGGVHNIRVMRNRGVNAGQCGLSAQPVFGGPAYFIRNLMYHVPAGVAWKFNVMPAGLLVYHNTVIAENLNASIFSNGHFRNNLHLAPDRPGRGIYRFANATSYSTWDYNGYRPNPKAADQYFWRSPEPGTLRDYEARRRFQPFRTLAELRAATGQEQHGVELDFDIFEDLRAPDPDKPYAVYRAGDLNFRLKPGGRAVDAGARLPNVNDGFTGAAPDLGANEVGKPEPVYGPRREKRT
ncbi:MAG: hypothetical protein IT158_15705 [Bryobacterales bacterium]|nr:hypothetical protein [Bryobacterales bacterium]